jgi:CPA1 family monovalent cation:H+ antiporter
VIAAELYTKHEARYKEATEELSTPNTQALSLRVLRMYAIGIEKKYLKELYHHNEVNESVYKRLTGKLQLQLEAVEAGNLEPNMSIHTDGKDIFESLAAKFRKFFKPETESVRIDNLLMYYRAQTIIARKVVKELESLDRSSAEHIFNADALSNVLSLYGSFRNQSEKKMNDLASSNRDNYDVLSHKLAAYGVHKIEENILKELFENQLITPKLYITLREQLHKQD